MHAQGVATTTIDEVLAASATSKSQFYQHFDDKSDLVYEVITLRADEILSWQRLRLPRRPLRLLGPTSCSVGRSASTAASRSTSRAVKCMSTVS